MKIFFCSIGENIRGNILFPARFIYLDDKREKSLNQAKIEMETVVRKFKENVEGKKFEDIGKVEVQMGKYTSDALDRLNSLHTEGARALKNDPKSVQELKNSLEWCRREIDKNKTEFLQIAQYARKKAVVSTQLENLNRYYLNNVAPDGKVRLDMRYIPFLQAAVGQIDASIKDFNLLQLPSSEQGILNDKKNFVEGLKQVKNGFSADVQSILTFQDLVKSNPELAAEQNTLPEATLAGLQHDIGTLGALTDEIAQLRTAVTQLIQNPSQEKFFELQKEAAAKQEKVQQTGSAIFDAKLGQGSTDLVSKLYQNLWEQKFHPLTTEIEVVNAELGGGPEMAKVIDAIEAALEQAKSADNDLRGLELTKGEQNAFEPQNIWEQPSANVRLAEGIDKALEQYSIVKKLLVTHNVPVALRASIEKTANDALNALIKKKTDLELRKAWNTYGDFAISFSKGTLGSNSKFLALPKEDQKKVLVELQMIQINITEDVEAKTCPRVTENFWQGKALVKRGSYEEGRKKLEKFLAEDVNSPEFSNNPALKEHKNTYISRTEQLLNAVDKITGTNKNFFDAQKAYEAGNIVEAKKLLKAYFSEAKQSKNPEDFTFVQSARELLKAIALQQYANVRARFEAAKAPPKTIVKTLGKGTVTEPNPEYQRYEQYVKALENIRQKLENGKSIDFNDAYEAESKGNPPLDPDYHFNFLVDETILDKGREGLLILARKYRQNGEYDLAESYFMQYFSKQLNALKEKQFSVEQMRKKWTERPQFMVSVKEKLVTAKKEYDENVQRRGSAWAAEHPWDDAKMRDIITNQALQEILPQELQKAQQDNFALDPGSLGSPEEQQAWQEFASMQGIHRRGTWAEPFAMTDAELDQLVKELPVDIAFMALSATGAGLAAGVARRAILQIGLSQLEKEVLEFGTGSLRRRALAYLGGLFVENAVLTGSNVLAQANSETTLAETMQSFRGEWSGSLEGLVRNKVVSAVTGGIGLGSLGTVARSKVGAGLLKTTGVVAEEFSENTLNAGLGAVSNAAKAGVGLRTSADYGKTDAMQDAAMFVGMQLGGALAKGVRKGKEAMARREKQKERAKERAKREIPLGFYSDENPWKAPSPTSPEPMPPEYHRMKQQSLEGTPLRDDELVEVTKLPGDQANKSPAPSSQSITLSDVSGSSPVVISTTGISERPSDAGSGPITDVTPTSERPTIIPEPSSVSTSDPSTPIAGIQASPDIDLTDSQIPAGGRVSFIEQPPISGREPTMVSPVTETGRADTLVDLEGPVSRTQRQESISPTEIIVSTDGDPRRSVSTQPYQSNQSADYGRLFPSDAPPTMPGREVETIPPPHYRELHAEQVNHFGNNNPPGKLHEELELALKGEGNPEFREITSQLKANDPEGYRFLKQNLKDLSPDCIQNVIRGKKVIIKNENGIDTVGYAGNKIAEGGVGAVQEFFYPGADGKLQRDVIKYPHEDLMQAMRNNGLIDSFTEECESGKIVQGFDSPYFVKPKSIDPNGKFIIYETDKNARDLSDHLQEAPPAKVVKSLEDTIEGLIYLHAQGYFHGDIKPENLLYMPGQDKTALLDTTPRKPDYITSDGGYLTLRKPISPGYFPNSGNIKIIQQNPGKYYRSIDTFAIGVMLSGSEKAIGHDPALPKSYLLPAETTGILPRLQSELPPEVYAKIEPRIKKIADDCKNPEISSDPNFLRNVLKDLRDIRNLIQNPQNRNNTLASPGVATAA